MITFTQTAVNKLQAIYEQDSCEGIVYLRIGIRGGGCAGFQHSLDFDNSVPSPLDESGSVNENITWICDPLSFQYLDETTIDHVTSFMREGFLFKNEKIKATCGCGNSVQYT